MIICFIIFKVLFTSLMLLIVDQCRRLYIHMGLGYFFCSDKLKLQDYLRNVKFTGSETCMSSSFWFYDLIAASLQGYQILHTDTLF